MWISGLKGLKTSKFKIRFDQHRYRLFQCPFLFRLQAPLCTSLLKTFTAVKRVKFAKVKRNTSKLRLLLSLSKV